MSLRYVKRGQGRQRECGFLSGTILHEAPSNVRKCGFHLSKTVLFSPSLWLQVLLPDKKNRPK